MNTANFTRVLIASTPMLEALGEEFGTDGAGLLVQGIQNTLGAVRNEEGLQMQQQPQPAPQP